MCLLSFRYKVLLWPRGLAAYEVSQDGAVKYLNAMSLRGLHFDHQPLFSMSSSFIYTPSSFSYHFPKRILQLLRCDCSAPVPGGQRCSNVFASEGAVLS